MQLIGALAAGIRGAANGTAEVYRRGTSTRVTWYEDFEGQEPVSTGADISLDENGGAVVYVGEIVRVVVRDSAGTVVRDFVVSISAKTVEYVGQSFTGVDPETGDSGVNFPVSVSDVLDCWADSAGSTNFRTTGSLTQLSSVATTAAALANTFIAVTEYGATGDGATDDLSAINTAIAAVQALGGGKLLFPPGTYRITTAAITVPEDVSLSGSGFGSCAIVQATAGVAVLTIGATTDPIVVEDITLRHSGAATGGVPEVTAANGTKSRFLRCAFGNSSRFTDYGISVAAAGTATEVHVDHCLFTSIVSGIIDARTSAPAQPLFISNSKFVANTTGTWSGIASPYFVASMCTLDFSTQTSGTGTGVDFTADSGPASSAFGVVTGCVFTNPTGGTANGIDIPALIPATVTFYEDQNTFGGSITAIYGGMDVTFASKGAWLKLGSRESRVLQATNNASHTARTDLYGTIVVTRSTNANSTITLTMVPEGTRGRLLVLNSSGGTIAAQTVAGPAGAGDFPVGGAGVSMLSGTCRIWEYVGIHAAAARHVLPIADGVACGSPT